MLIFFIWFFNKFVAFFGVKNRCSCNLKTFKNTCIKWRFHFSEHFNKFSVSASPAHSPTCHGIRFWKTVKLYCYVLCVFAFQNTRNFIGPRKVKVNVCGITHKNKMMLYTKIYCFLHIFFCADSPHRIIGIIKRNCFYLFRIISVFCKLF